MDKTQLKNIITQTAANPYIKWNDRSLLNLIEKDPVYNVFIFNKLCAGLPRHGYYSLLHNLTSSIDGVVVEVGNCEGLGILSIYDALKPSSIFYTLDIEDDNRFVNNKIKNDPRVHIMNDFNSLDPVRISKTFDKKSISMIFFDTLHTYEQIVAEYHFWLPYLKDDCVMLIDDIRPVTPDRTKWKFHEDLDWASKYDVTEWAHNDTGFGVYLK